MPTVALPPVARNGSPAFRAVACLKPVFQNIENFPADKDGLTLGAVSVFQLVSRNIAQVAVLESLRPAQVMGSEQGW